MKKKSYFTSYFYVQYNLFKKLSRSEYRYKNGVYLKFMTGSHHINFKNLILRFYKPLYCICIKQLNIIICVLKRYNFSSIFIRQLFLKFKLIIHKNKQLIFIQKFIDFHINLALFYFVNFKAILWIIIFFFFF